MRLLGRPRSTRPNHPADGLYEVEEGVGGDGCCGSWIYARLGLHDVIGCNGSHLVSRKTGIVVAALTSALLIHSDEALQIRNINFGVRRII